jgi:hypothetical protein
VQNADGNISLSDARPVQWPVAIEGAVAELQSRYFRIEVKKEQRLVFDAVARRLSSPLDARLRLLDRDGKVLVTADDSPGIAPDCRLAHTFGNEGVYFLEIRDTLYAGSANHRFRLRIGDLPESVPVEFRGEGPLIREAEPNDARPAATAMASSGVIHGEFDKPRDVDWYRFTGSKGQRVAFMARTKSAGSAAHVMLEVWGSKRIAQSKPMAADEGVVRTTLPAEGEYWLGVSELTGRAGGMRYYVDAMLHDPGFVLSTEADRFVADGDGQFSIPVKVERGHYAGAIRLMVEGTEAQVVGEPIPAGQNAASVKIKLIGDGIRTFSLYGLPAGETSADRAKLGTMPALKKSFPDMFHPPIELDGVLQVIGKPAGK